VGALVLGLYTEGDTDKRFLQPVIRRAVTKILVEHRRNDRWDDLTFLWKSSLCSPPIGNSFRI
jgi:hypothetical protein